jgi:hypothetical protein
MRAHVLRFGCLGSEKLNGRKMVEFSLSEAAVQTVLWASVYLDVEVVWDDSDRGADAQIWARAWAVLPAKREVRVAL